MYAIRQEGTGVNVTGPGGISAAIPGLSWADIETLLKERIETREKEALSSRQRATSSGRPAEIEDGPAPAPINPDTGQHKDYWVLPKEERDKGYIRPVRRSYIHVGMRPKYPLRPITAQEKVGHSPDVVMYEEYPATEHPTIGRAWTEKQLKSGCGSLTRMSDSIAETYARNPTYYGATFCCNCGQHFSVGANGEFEWEDGTKVGT